MPFGRRGEIFSDDIAAAAMVDPPRTPSRSPRPLRRFLPHPRPPRAPQDPARYQRGGTLGLKPRGQLSPTRRDQISADVDMPTFGRRFVGDQRSISPALKMPSITPSTRDLMKVDRGSRPSMIRLVEIPSDSQRSMCITAELTGKIDS